MDKGLLITRGLGCKGLLVTRGLGRCRVVEVVEVIEVVRPRQLVSRGRSARHREKPYECVVETPECWRIRMQLLEVNDELTWPRVGDTGEICFSPCDDQYYFKITGPKVNPKKDEPEILIHVKLLNKPDDWD